MKGPFKLFIFGQLSPAATAHEITIHAEFEGSRAVSHRVLKSEERQSLQAAVGKLRSAIETGGSRDYTVDQLEQFGANLLDFAFPGKVGQLLHRATGASLEPLPFELFVEDPELASWPWEYLYDRTSDRFLCQDFHPISRGIFTLATRKALTTELQEIKLLVVIGVLDSDLSAKPADEIAWIEGVLDKHLKGGVVNWKVIRAVSPADIDNELLLTDYDVLHFFGHARYDHARDQGYLALQTGGGDGHAFYADDFARMLRDVGKSIRLVFLNGCETGRSGGSGDPARSAIAAAALEAGIPAIIATQFSMPDVNAHVLAAKIYMSLSQGHSLNEAMKHGRRALNYIADPATPSRASRTFFDWGIPVLYASEAGMRLFPPISAKTETDNIALTSSVAGSSLSNRIEIVFIDFDVKVAFLPQLVHAANAVQGFYRFSVEYLPCPTSAIRIADSHGQKTLYIPAVEDYLRTHLKVRSGSVACVLTPFMLAGDKSYVDGKPFDDYIGFILRGDATTCLTSTADLRRYATEANVSFPMAVLNVALSMILPSRNPRIKMHAETLGCLFDFCDDRTDVVVSLRKMALEHEECRSKVDDPQELKAVDALLAMSFE